MFRIPYIPINTVLNKFFRDWSNCIFDVINQNVYYYDNYVLSRSVKR